jgi:hypothetical protein
MDVEARKHWVEYSRAKDRMLEHTDRKKTPWHIVDADNKKRARSGPAVAITDVSASIHSAVSWASVSMGRNRCSGEFMSIGMQSVTVVAGWRRLWSWRQREHR